jgi:hypothetical protein
MLSLEAWLLLVTHSFAQFILPFAVLVAMLITDLAYEISWILNGLECLKITCRRHLLKCWSYLAHETLWIHWLKMLEIIENHVQV